MNYLYDALRIHTVLSQFLIIATLYFFCAYRKNNSIVSYSGFVIAGIFLSLIRIFFGFLFSRWGYFFIYHQTAVEKQSLLFINRRFLYPGPGWI